MSESMSMSQQQLSFDDEINEAINPSTHPISAGSLSDIRKTSISSVGTGGTKEFFSSISSDINGLATQTTSMFNDLFGEKKKKIIIIIEIFLRVVISLLVYATT